MAKYNVTFSCGHTETVQLYGKTSERERWIAWAEENKVCADCWQQELAEQRQRAEAEAAERELPQLTGSPKQIAWAETIRADLVEKIEQGIARVRQELAKDPAESAYDLTTENITAEQLDAAFQCLCGKSAARFWIDHRDEQPFRMIKKIVAELPTAQKETARALAAAAEAEAVTRPASPATETVARIDVETGRVVVRFDEKREDFREIVKGLGFRWSMERRCWQQPAAEYAAADAAARTGHTLLAGGFIIRIFDEAVRAMAVTGDYCARWVSCRTDKGRFAFAWPRGEDFYRLAKRLPGARYDKPNVTVSAEHYEEVLDFARIHGFGLSPGARKLADEAAAARAAALTVTPAAAPDPAAPDPKAPPARLDVPESVDIPDALRDVDDDPATTAGALAAAGFDPLAMGGKMVDGHIFKPDANPGQRGECARCGRPGVWIAGAGEHLCHRHQDDY